MQEELYIKLQNKKQNIGRSLTYAQYTGLSSDEKTSGKLFFITDQGCIYKNNISYGGTDSPGKIFKNGIQYGNNGHARIYKNGIEYANGPTIVSIPTVTVGTYTYNGSAQGPTITGLDSEHCTVTNATKTSPGTYTMTISLNDPSACIWSDDTTASKIYQYTINKLSIVIPTVTVGQYVYNGSEQGPTVTNLDTAHCTVTNGKKIQPGNYTMSISLNDTSTSIWTDNTSANKTYPYSIEEAWSYDTGTNEAALLNNIKHPEQETIGKIYYIQAYYHNNNSLQSQSTPVISQGMPYMVIGVNHDGTTNTMDLRSMVPAYFIGWITNPKRAWEDGKYTTSNIYSWLPNTCANGYSANIKAKMCYMTERWREATGNATGTMMSRTTKCKLLNPIELFGYSSATFDPNVGEYITSSDHKTDFANPSGAKYGSIYPAFEETITYSNNRYTYKDKDLTNNNTDNVWTNSYLGFRSRDKYARNFTTRGGGNCSSWICYRGVGGVTPVIRLSNNPS